MIKYMRAIRNEWILWIILIAAFALRMWHLTTQSLWLDELHTMNEAAPYISWKEMFGYLRCCDQHPPLYFIIERIAFIIFGHTEFVARFISVIAGTVSVWAVWQLGKEIRDKHLGYLAAALTCVNYYGIVYSQEARGYIFAFLFAILSFTYFIRLVKSPGKKNIVLYALFALLLMYSHYYGAIVVIAQALLALVFIIQEKGGARLSLFRSFLFSGVIIILGYLPWVPFVLEMSDISSFWLSNPSPDFMPAFFYEYFGGSDLLKPLLLSLLIVYILHVALTAQTASGKLKENPLQLSFIIFLFWIFITYLVPYLRSLLVVPMLHSRYTIVVLPALLLAIAYGIYLFKLPLLRYSIVALFVLLSLTDIVVVKKYYTTIHKTQFREMTAFVVGENAQNFPIINQVTNWQQQYYLRKFGSKALLLTGKKEALIDSILSRKSPRWQLDGFWIVGAHGEKPLDDEKLKLIDTAYNMAADEKFYDAWAQLFIHKKTMADQYRVIDYQDFENVSILEDIKAAAIWGGTIQTRPISLKKGLFKLTITAMGTPVKGTFPHLNIYLGQTKVGDYFVKGAMEDKSFTVESPGQDSLVLKIEMDNDFYLEGEGDRNAFVRKIVLEKLPE